MSQPSPQERGRISIEPREGGRSGAVPGAFETDDTAPDSVVTALSFGPESLEELQIDDLDRLPSLLESRPITWVNVDGLGNGDTIRKLGEIFGLHALALEDVVHVHQRTKVEDYGSYEYVVIRMSNLQERLDIEQVSIFFGEGFVLTFQERVGDCLDPLRSRIRNNRGQIRTSGPDYLAYAVLDTVIDNYFPVLERYGDRLERLEDEVLVRTDRRLIGEIRDLRHDLLELRRAVWPLRDAIDRLRREDNPHVGAGTRLYLRDCQDHAVRLGELVETYRELSTGLMDIYLSAASHRMNEVMQVLTVLGAIFLPLTFITGLYGMNFERGESPLNMPELDWYWGYPFALGLMTVTALGLLLFFWRKGWLGKRP